MKTIKRFELFNKVREGMLEITVEKVCDQISEVRNCQTNERYLIKVDDNY